MLPTSNIKKMWTWLRRVSPVKTYHSLEKVPDYPGNVRGSSGIYYEPLAWWDGQNYCWRTWQACLIEGYQLFLGPWPRSGMTRNGIAYQLPTLVAGNFGTESGLWPTPNATAFKGADYRRGVV